MDTNDIPDGYGADIVLCQDIVHIAVGFSAWQWWAVGGGIARFDLSDHDGDGVTEEWITPITEDNSNMVDRDARALACDEQNEILYVGFDTDNVGIDRFDYSSNNFLDTLLPRKWASRRTQSSLVECSSTRTYCWSLTSMVRGESLVS